MAKSSKATQSRKKRDEVISASLYAQSLLEASLDPLVTISPKEKIIPIYKAIDHATGCAGQQLIGSYFRTISMNAGSANLIS